MMNPEGGVQPGTDEGSGDRGPHDSVSVIEKIVRGCPFGVPAEPGDILGRVVAEPDAPVDLSRLGFDVGWISTSDPAGQRVQLVPLGRSLFEVLRLGADLGSDELFPETFREGLLGRDLFVDPDDNLSVR